jgi:polyhydroxyalkanoate synthesis regulator phasin
MTTQILSRSSSENGQNTLKNSLQTALREQNIDKQMTQVKETYSVVQQVKYLHLQAEIDVLLQQLQTLKQN